MGSWFRILACIAVLGSCCSAALEEDLKSLVQRAFELHQKGQFAEALPLLRRAYALEPGDYFVNLGVTIFFTGLSGSGKSTIANVLMTKFLEVGGRPVTLLD